jgi:hypothetical protein
VQLEQRLLDGKRRSNRIQVSSAAMLECTLGPSGLVAAQQLQDMVQGAQAAAASQDALLELQYALVAAQAAGSPGSPINGCWLLNQTGAPLSWALADAAAPLPAPGGGAALPAGTVSGAPIATAAAGQLTPLEVWDPRDLMFCGKYVEWGAGAQPRPASPPREPPAGSRLSRRPGAAGRQLLLQLPGQPGFCEPVLIDRVGLTGLSMPAAAAAPAAQPCRWVGR